MLTVSFVIARPNYNVFTRTITMNQAETFALQVFHLFVSYIRFPDFETIAFLQPYMGRTWVLMPFLGLTDTMNG
jgi:hypothetical protein